MYSVHVSKDSDSNALLLASYGSQVDVPHSSLVDM